MAAPQILDGMSLDEVIAIIYLYMLCCRMKYQICMLRKAIDVVLRFVRGS